MITRTTNPQVRNLVQLRRKAKARDEQDVFVVEGIKMYEEAPAERLEQIYLSESFSRRYGALPAGKAGKEPVILSDEVFEAASDTKTPQGILCVVRQYHYRLDELCLQGPGRRPPLFVVLENLQDPGNLGTIVRTAEGAGATGILLGEGCVDIYNPKVIRSTMGSIYRMPFCYADDLPGVLRDLRRRGIRSYAAHLEGACSYEEPDYRQPSAFVIGNESRGLTDGTASAADARIRIPMCGKVESLNAGVASAVLLYEAARQRRKNKI